MGKFRNVKILDNILEFLDNNQGFFSGEEIKKDLEKKESIDDIQPYLDHLINDNFIAYNGVKSKVKITIEGAVKNSLGGYMKDARTISYDTNFKWFFWLFSAILSLTAFILSAKNGCNPSKENPNTEDKVLTISIEDSLYLSIDTLNHDFDTISINLDIKKQQK